VAFVFSVSVHLCLRTFLGIVHAWFSKEQSSHPEALTKTRFPFYIAQVYVLRHAANPDSENRDSLS